MRNLTLCFCVLTVLLSHLRVDAQQTINFPKGRMALREVFVLIEEQSGHTIAYNEEFLNADKTVAPPNGKNLEQTLKALLKRTGTEAVIDGNTIFIIPVAARADRDSIQSHPVVNLLEESVIVGYGSMHRRDISSAIGSMDPEEITGRAYCGVDALLQGRIAGVNVQASSGSIGSRSRVSIRGIGSLTAGNEPLYVVDGIPISNTISDAGGWEGEQTSALTDIHPGDIESIRVLKDAASAAIYGSRATNGVILITTKKGAKGAPKISADAGMSLSYIPDLEKLKVADADLYLEVQNEAIDNYNRQTGENVSHIVNPYPERGQFCWADLVLRTAISWKASASVSGGTDRSRYYISANVRHNEGVIIGNKAEKYGVRANLECDIKRWLSAGINLSANHNHTPHVPNGNMGTSMLTHALEHRPWDVPYHADGSYTIKDKDLLHYNLLQALNEQNAFNNNYRIIGKGYIRLNILDGLSFRSDVGGDFMYTEDYIYYNSKHMYGNSVGKLTDARKVYSSLVTDNIINYSKAFGCGLALDATLGHTFQQDVSSTSSQTGQGFPSEDFSQNSVAAEYLDISTGRSSWAMQSVIFRTTLNWHRRYMLTLSARTDGSSKFAPEHRYGFFPSVSGGWVLSEEPFWKDSNTRIKIKASCGMTGNQGGIGAYAFQALANGGYNYINESGIAMMTQGNRDLRWEKALQYNIGAEMSFFAGRMKVETDIFRKDTKDLLYNKPVTATSGFTNQLCNIGAMRNDGLEITLEGNIGKGDFRWQGGFNISFVRNRLTELTDDDGILTSGSYHALKVGEEVGSFYMIKMLGIYQKDEDVPKKQYEQGVRAGDVMYEDVNGDGDIDTAGDSQFCGSANPLFTGGLSSTFSWKGFDVSLLFAFSYGNNLYQIWNGGLRLGNGLWPSQESEALARWTGPGTSDSVPRAIYGMTWNSTRFISTRYLHDASYLRCKSLSLSYTLPAKAAKKVGMDLLKIYIQADNLFLISPYRFIDPEVNSSLDATKMGLDNMWLPQPRTFSFGVKIQL